MLSEEINRCFDGENVSVALRNDTAGFESKSEIGFTVV